MLNVKHIPTLYEENKIRCNFLYRSMKTCFDNPTKNIAYSTLTFDRKHKTLFLDNYLFFHNMVERKHSKSSKCFICLFIIIFNRFAFERFFIILGYPGMIPLATSTPVTIDLSTALPPLLVFMINASLASIRIIM